LTGIGVGLVPFGLSNVPPTVRLMALLVECVWIGPQHGR